MAQAAATTMAPSTATDTLAASTQLQLMWLASPALPVGGFSYSEGLEAAVESGRVSNEAQASAWLVDQLNLGQARGDLALAGAAFAAWRARDGARIEALNAWVQQTRESSELRQQAEQMGRSLADWLRQRDLGSSGRDGAPNEADPRVAQLAALKPAPTWPVAFALAAERTGADTAQALQAMAFGWAENMVQAAVKAVPLGQNAGQRLLGTLAGHIPAAVATAQGLDDQNRQAFTPMLAILCAQHEAQYSRLFRS